MQHKKHHNHHHPTKNTTTANTTTAPPHTTTHHPTRLQDLNLEKIRIEKKWRTMNCEKGIFKLEVSCDYGVVRSTNVKKKRKCCGWKMRRKKIKNLCKNWEKGRNFFTKLEEASKKRKRISGENVEFVESQEHEKKYCTRITPGMDATLTTNSEKL